MITINQKLILLVIFKLVLLAKSDETKREGRDFHGYYPSEEDKKWEYQIIQHPSNYNPIKDGYSEWDKNPMLPLLGKGLNLILVKIGILGIVKAVMAMALLVFLVKLPLVLLKLAFLKSFFLPFLVGPLLVGLFMNQMNRPSEGGGVGMGGGMVGGMMSGAGGGAGTGEKPGETQEDNEGMMGRELSDNLTSVAWEGMKMFATSERCVERISCLIGASNSNSSVGSLFSRMLKFLHYSSPPAARGKISLIREAFMKGSQTLTCNDEDYKCQSPELVVQHGLSKVKIF